MLDVKVRIIVFIIGCFTGAFAGITTMCLMQINKTVNYEITIPKRKCSVEEGFNCIKKLNSNCQENPSYCQGRE